MIWTMIRMARLMGQVDETEKTQAMQRNIGGDRLMIWYVYGTGIASGELIELLIALENFN